MRRIPFSQGKVALIDDEDFEEISKYKWYALKCKKYFCAVRREPGRIIYMHREILGLKHGDGKETDHIDHNTLDNRRSNIRICTTAQNQANQNRQQGGTSVYKGVYWHKRMCKWCVNIYQNLKHIHLGYFEDEIEAAKAYDIKARELFGEFAKTNF